MTSLAPQTWAGDVALPREAAVLQVPPSPQGLPAVMAGVRGHRPQGRGVPQGGQAAEAGTRDHGA